MSNFNHTAVTDPLSVARLTALALAFTKSRAVANYSRPPWSRAASNHSCPHTLNGNERPQLMHSQARIRANFTKSCQVIKWVWQDWMQHLLHQVTTAANHSQLQWLTASSSHSCLHAVNCGKGLKLMHSQPCPSADCRKQELLDTSRLMIHNF
jgi:hypothetical protein